MSGPSAAEVSALLAIRIDALVAELFPAARRDGAEWRIGSIVGEPGQSLAVHRHGIKAGVWGDFAAEHGGDALDLVAQVLFYGDLGKARRWALSWLGLGDGLTAQRRRPLPTHSDEQKRASRIAECATRLWNEGRPPRGTLVEVYLHSRGLALPDTAELRFHESCPFRDQRYPAMLAALRCPLRGEFRSLHRTALRPEGDAKAEIPNPKRMLGLIGNSAVAVRLVPETGKELGLAEGIENALAATALFDVPTWATGSARLLSRFPPLPGVESLIIFADRGHVGERAAQRCAQRRNAGKAVRILRPRLAGNDWNDILRRES